MALALPEGRGSQFTCVTPYGRGGQSSRVRVFDWCDYLGLRPAFLDYIGTSNHSPRTILKSPFRTMVAEVSLRRSKPFSTLLLSRHASPFSTGKLESRLLSQASWGVYDFDDAIFASSSDGVRGMMPKSRIWRNAVQSADWVIAGNDFLADSASEFNTNVITIPSCVNPDAYVRKTSYGLTDRLRVVWLGSPSTEKYLANLANPLAHFARTTGAQFHVISAGDAPLGELEPYTVRVPWLLELPEQRLHEYDIAIAPLTDGPVERGKCAYKILQYGSAGLPVVGSPVGANAPALRGMKALMPESSTDWIDALLTVAEMSDSSRRALGDAAVEAVTAAYSFSAWANAWISILHLD